MVQSFSRRQAFWLAAGLTGTSRMALAAMPPPWRTLIPATAAPDGTIPGWRPLGGRATFSLEGGQIVGRSVEKSRNSFLTTLETFDDFILEFQLKTDPRLNTGMMIRSESRADYRDGVVHGYQVEIDPSDRRWTGGIYDEERRLWLNSPAHRPDTLAAFRSGDWNHLRVEAIGPRIRTWLNGNPAANLLDDLTPRGFFGLQVHDIGADPANAGMEVRLCEMRIITDRPARFATPIDASDDQDFIANHLSAERRALGWRLLWDGRTAAGWAGLSAAGWGIGDGVLRVQGPATPALTADPFTAFELELDVLLSEGAEGSIDYAHGACYRLAHGPRGQGMMATGSLLDQVPARNLTDPNPEKPSVKPPDLWNRVRIRATGERVEHWLNGSKLVDASLAGTGMAGPGPIVLRSDRGPMAFRSLRIRPLTGAGG